MKYINERNTNIMTLNILSTPAMYAYRKPNISSCKCTFADGSVYFQKVIANDRTYAFKGEENKLYLDEECTVIAPITRRQKIRECRKCRLL